MYETFIYYVLPFVSLYVGLYIVGKAIEQMVWAYIENFDVINDKLEHILNGK